MLQVRAEILPYSEAAALCGGTLPDYIAKVFVEPVLRKSSWILCLENVIVVKEILCLNRVDKI